MFPLLFAPGAMKPSEVSIDFIVRDGNKLILNTRFAQALESAGISRAQWNAVNRTGQEMYENMPVVSPSAMG